MDNQEFATTPTMRKQWEQQLNEFVDIQRRECRTLVVITVRVHPI
jgi:hypothetical protein